MNRRNKNPDFNYERSPRPPKDRTPLRKPERRIYKGPNPRGIDDLFSDNDVSDTSSEESSDNDSGKDPV
jgi:hypothetical protein